MKSIVISKPDKSLTGTVNLPASKSISNRLLMIRALTPAGFTIHNLSQADDTALLQRHLETILRGNGKKRVAELDCGNAGTVMRFLTSFLSVRTGKWMLTGSDRMKQRPIGILVDALRHLGVTIDYLAKPDYPPILISGGNLQSNRVSLDPRVSSQFTTALLLIAPVLPGGLNIHLKGKQVSAPYTDMTVRLMQQFGVKVKKSGSGIRVSHSSYFPADIAVEADWSAAAFWYEAAVFAHEVDLELTGLNQNSLQGDAILPEIYRNFGIRTEFTGRGIRLTRFGKNIDGFYYDFTDYPDIAQAVMATCTGLGIRGRFEGVQSLQIKETDRLRAMKYEMEKLGIRVTISKTGDLITALEIEPVKRLFPEDLAFETYGDHRTAMSLAPLALVSGKLKIINPEVVAKSYPDFWEHMKNAGFQIR